MPRYAGGVLRRCDGSDPNLIARDGSRGCPCGLTFDDVDRMVVWPHTPLGLTQAELEALWAEVTGEAWPPQVAR
jgi:hypothetical protein